MLLKVKLYSWDFVYLQGPKTSSKWSWIDNDRKNLSSPRCSNTLNPRKLTFNTCQFLHRWTRQNLKVKMFFFFFFFLFPPLGHLLKDFWWKRRRPQKLPTARFSGSLVEKFLWTTKMYNILRVLSDLLRFELCTFWSFKITSFRCVPINFFFLSHSPSTFIYLFIFTTTMGKSMSSRKR